MISSQIATVILQYGVGISAFAFGALALVILFSARTAPLKLALPWGLSGFIVAVSLWGDLSNVANWIKSADSLARWLSMPAFLICTVINLKISADKMAENYELRKRLADLQGNMVDPQMHRVRRWNMAAKPWAAKGMASDD